MNRIFDFGKIDFNGTGRKINRVTVEMSYKENNGKWCFSASANIWNSKNTDIISGGQILNQLTEYFNDNSLFNEIYRLWKLYHLNDFHPECKHQHALGWHELAKKEVKIYHWRLTNEVLSEQRKVEKTALTALRCGAIFKPGKEEQRLANLPYSLCTWTEELPSKFYMPKKPIYLGDESHIETAKLGWLRETEHPEGLLCKPCPVCGYRYGAGWRHFPVPEEDEKIIFNLLTASETADIKEV